MGLEYKELELKQIDELGTFEGIACKYGNVDFANDRLMKSAGKSNNSKEIPILYQHNVNEIIGKGILTDGQEGIMLKASLFLDKDNKDNNIFPLAWKAYELAKKGLMKLSIGYSTKDYEYKTANGITVRELKDIDVIEVSTVLFPCNDKAVITSVKSNGGEKMEEKAMGFSDILKVQNAQEMRWKLQDALNASFRGLIEDVTMTEEAKIAQLNSNVDEFATAYKANMTELLKASGKNATAKKSILDTLETKKNENVEIKEDKKEERHKDEKSDIIELETKELEALEMLYKNVINKEENK